MGYTFDHRSLLFLPPALSPRAGRSSSPPPSFARSSHRLSWKICRFTSRALSFNTLNTISSLMYEDVRAADAMLAQLSELLRLTLRVSRTHEIRLAEELEITSVLELMQKRYETSSASATPSIPRCTIRSFRN